MSDRYIKIDNGICPDCGEKMKRGDWSRTCHSCGVKYRFNDDMGPGSYSATFIVGGKKWKQKTLNEIIKRLQEIEDHYHPYDHRIETIRENLVELTKELEQNKEKENA